jgi:hypothetical protein
MPGIGREGRKRTSSCAIFFRYGGEVDPYDRELLPLTDSSRGGILRLYLLLFGLEIRSNGLYLRIVKQV